jgi:hypothetical protein
MKVPDPFHRVAAQMTVAGLAGFLVSAQFVSLEALEIPYYVALLGMGALKLASDPLLAADAEPMTSNDAYQPNSPTPALSPIVA